jgi:hypothetical protein
MATASTDKKRVLYKYLGQDDKGYLRIRHGDTELMIAGRLYAVSTPKSGPTSTSQAKSKSKLAPAVRRIKVALVELRATSGYAKSETDKRYDVVTQTGEQMRVVGQVHSQTPTTKKNRVLVERAAPLSSKSTVTKSVQVSSNNTLVSTAEEKKKTRGGVKPTRDKLLEAEKTRVSSLIKLGHDPEVRMQYVAYFVGQSPGNLYKKISAGTFPAPYKKGGGSFWKHSTLVVYQNNA